MNGTLGSTCRRNEIRNFAYIQMDCHTVYRSPCKFYLKMLTCACLHGRDWSDHFVYVSKFKLTGLQKGFNDYHNDLNNHGPTQCKVGL